MYENVPPARPIESSSSELSSAHALRETLRAVPQPFKVESPGALAALSEFPSADTLLAQMTDAEASISVETSLPAKGTVPGSHDTTWRVGVGVTQGDISITGIYSNEVQEHRLDLGSGEAAELCGAQACFQVDRQQTFEFDVQVTDGSRSRPSSRPPIQTGTDNALETPAAPEEKEISQRAQDLL